MKHLRLIATSLIPLAVILLPSNMASTNLSAFENAPVVGPPTGQWFDYVAVIMLENHGINDTYYNGGNVNSCLGNCTYFSALANVNGLAENLTMGKVQGASLGSYIAITSGYGNTNSSCNNGPSSGCILNIPNIVDRLDSVHLTWKAYMEGYPILSGCSNTAFSGSPNYYSVNHNPFAYYSDIVNNQTRCSNIVSANSKNVVQNSTGCWPTAIQYDDLLINDLNSVSTASNYMFLTPNSIDNTHDCPNNVSAGNAWMQEMIPTILGSTLFQTRRAALFVAFDEPRTNTNLQLYSVWASNPSNPTTLSGRKSNHSYTLYSPLRTIEDNWNLTPFFASNDGSASNMREFFRATSLVPDFSIYSTPSSLMIQTATSGTSTISLFSLDNFTGTLTLSSSVSQSGPTASLSPQRVFLARGGSATSTLTVASQNPSNFTVTVAGTNGTLTHSTIVSVIVAPASVVVVVATDSGVGPSSLATAGGQKLIEDSAGRMITVYVDSSGRMSLSYANSDPISKGWSTPVKSSTPASGYAWPAAVLVSLTSLRIIAGGGSASGVITDIPVTITRDSQNNITAVSFGTPTTLDSPGPDRYPTAVLTHNGDILLAWAQNSTHTTVKSLRWDPSTGWTSLAGSSTTPDTVLVDSSTIQWFVPNLIERPDNHNIYLFANRFTGPPSTIAFNKATWNGSSWSWGVQNLTYETNASDADDDFVGLAWDPVKSLVVAQYGMTGTFKYGVFTLNSQDVKTHLDTPALAVTGDRGWASIGVQTTTGDYYIFLISVNTDAGSGPLGYIRLPSGGSWNATIIWLNTASDNQVTSIRPTGSSATLDLLYSEGTLAPVKVKFTRLIPLGPASLSLAPNPTSLSVKAGSSGPSTITVSSVNGFTGTVNLSTTVSPPGPTAVLSAMSITLTSGGTATSTLTVNSTTSGTYTVTIKGTSGTLTNSATVVVAVTDFIISATSPNASPSGGSAISTITVSAVNGFAGTVILADTVPANLGCAPITPSSITNSGTATVSCSSTTAGTYRLTITGTSGTLSHTTTATFMVTDFTLTATSPAAVNVGVSATSPITVTAVNGFTGTVSLTDNVPTGLTCGAISPPSVTNSGTATVSCSSTAAGTYTLTITGTSGTLSHSSTAIFAVNDFTITASSPTTVTVGTSATSTITVGASGGFSGTVSITDTVPAGLTCGAVSPSSVTVPPTATATVSCSSATAGTYTLTITGTSGFLTYSATATFTLTDFTVSANSSASVTVGTSATSTITVGAVSAFTGTVTLTDTVPPGLTCGTISPATVTNSGTATVACSSNTPGTYTLTITGTSGTLSRSTTTTFTVTDFTVTATSPAATTAGASVTSAITVTAVNGFTGTISLTDTVPSGLTCASIIPTSVTNSGTATVSCSSTTAGNYTLTIMGASGTLSHSTTVTFTVTDFDITAASPAAVNSGASVTSTITVTYLNGFTGTISLTETVSSGLTCGAFSPASMTNPGTATVSCSSTDAGTYTLTITGTSGTLSHSTAAAFTFADFMIAATSPSGASGSSLTSTISVTALSGFTGTVSLTDNVPSGLTCGAITPNSITNSGTATLTCSATLGTFTVTIAGASGTLSHSTPATFTFATADFTISATSITINAGASGTSTVTVTSQGTFTGTVSLTDSLPAGLTCGSISPSSLTMTTSPQTATVSCGASVAGNYTLTITGTSGTLNHSTTTTFTVTDFTITGSSPAAIDAGKSATSIITVAGLNGFAGNVSLSDNVPVGLTCGIITPPAVTGSGTATLSCSSTSASTYPVTITGSAGSLRHTATAIFAFVDFTIIASSPGSTPVGSSATSTITVAAVNGFAGNVTLSDTLLSGLTCNTITPATVTGSGTASLSCSSTNAGTYTVTVTSTDGIVAHSATAAFTFTDFKITASTASVAVNVGATTTVTITVTPLNGFIGAVELTANPSAGLNATVSPSTITGGSGTATLTVRSTTAGNYTVTVTGTSGSTSHGVTIRVRVEDFSLATNTASIRLAAGTSGTVTINLASINGFTGTVSLSAVCSAPGPKLSLSSNSLSLSPGGPGSSILRVGTTHRTAPGTYTITVTATSSGITHTVTVLLTVA